MGDISIDAYRAMGGGKYNLGAVVVKTDAATGEQRLAKVNNSLNGRKVAVLPEESRQARTLLYSLMSADLAKTLGRDVAGLSKFRDELRGVLLGAKNEKADSELARAGDGDLAKAFNLFDAFKTKKLSERTIEVRVKTAESKFVLTKARLKQEAGTQKEALVSAQNAAWDDVYVQVMHGEDVAEVPGEAEEVKNFRQAAFREFRSAKEDADTALAERKSRKKYNDETSADYKALMKTISSSYDDLLEILRDEADALGPWFKAMGRASGVKISEKSFRRILTGRPDAVKQTAMAVFAGADGALDGDPKMAILKAVRTLRDGEIAAAGNAGKSKSLNRSETALFRFLKSAKGPDDVKNFLANHAEFQNCLFNEFLGGLRLLAGSPNADMSLTLTIPLSADGKKKGVITLLQGGDGTLRIGYKGHTFALESGASTLFVAIQNSRTVTPPDRRLYEGYNPETGDTESSRAELKRTHESWTERPFDGNLLDQGKFLEKFDAMLDKLVDCNNRHPGVYGGSPHFGNAMPMLNADGARQVRVPFVDVSFKRFTFSGERPVNFMRTVLNDRIKKAPIFAPAIRLFAKCLGVPLEEAGGGQYTLFEKAARYLHGMRILAQNANYILSRFGGLEESGLALGTAEERRACYAICDEFSKLTQFTVHPYYNGRQYGGAELAGAIRSTLVKHCRTFEKALETGQLDKFFEKIASGICFNDCMGVMEDLGESWRVFDVSLDEYLQSERPVAAPQGIRPQPQPEPVRPEADSGVRTDEADNVVTSAWPGPQRKNPANRAQNPLAIDPVLAAGLHVSGGIEPLSSFLDDEVRALHMTFNPFGTTKPRVFSWEGEVKPFLKARLDEMEASLREDAAQNEYNRLVDRARQLQEKLRQAQQAKRDLQFREGAMDIASVDKEIDECEAELGNLKNVEYLKKTVNEAAEKAGLKFSWYDDEWDDDWTALKGDLKVEQGATGPNGEQYVNVRYDDGPKFWEFVEKLWADAGGYIKRDGVTEFVRGAERPGLVEPLDKRNGGDNLATLSVRNDYTRIVEILPSGERRDAVAYERAVHGDKDNFIKTTDEKTGASVWRTLDGRFEIQSATQTTDKHSAAADGDVAYKEGDFMFRLAE